MAQHKSIIRVFPRRTSLTPTDALVFAGKRASPQLWRPVADEVHVSVAFTWDVEQGHQLAEAWAQYYPVVKIGGPAIEYGGRSNAFVPGVYLRHGVTFTSRGCNRKCPWCLVPGREGRLQLIEAFAPGWVIQDNNFLMCPKEHRERVYEMLRVQRKAARFMGGLDTREITSGVADELRGLRIEDVFMAADTKRSLRLLTAATELLSFLPKRKRRCYVLIAFGSETLREATERLEEVWDIGCAPFAQLYQPPDRYIEYSTEWKSLAREWSRPAIMAAAHGGWGD